MAGAPEGCGPGVSSVYYNMCDLGTVWGIVAETVAAAGVLASSVLFVILGASLPSVTDKKRKATVALQAGVLTFTLGLFGLTFAFIVGRYSASCAARRFLFGVLFAGCLACLVTHGLWLLLLGRRGRGPKSWVLCLGALALWLVEVIINTEWLILTLVRGPADGVPVPVPDLPCSIANLDFVTSLTYVMVLLLAVVLLPFPSLARKRWRRDAAFILTTGISTVAIWIAWILMYTHGNQVVGNASWDDPTLAVAVVTNAWVFLFLYTIPEICLLTKEDPEEEEPQDLDHVYPPRSLIYNSVRKEAGAAPQSVYIENKAFSMEEPPAGTERSEIYNPAHTRRSKQPWQVFTALFASVFLSLTLCICFWKDVSWLSRLPYLRLQRAPLAPMTRHHRPRVFSPAGPTKPVSPYGAYNGQVRGCVYQPTEIALIAKGLTKASVRVCLLQYRCGVLFNLTSLLLSRADGPRHNDPSSQNPNREPRKWRLPAPPSRATGFLSLQWMRETGNPLK